MVSARLLCFGSTGVSGTVGAECFMGTEDFGVGRPRGVGFVEAVEGVERRLPIVVLEERLDRADSGASIWKVFVVKAR